MTKVKLCGLSRESDIAAVNKLKPDLVGFVFAKKSKRYVSPEQAEHLKSLLAPGILAAGVFVNEPVEAVAELLDRGVIDVAQLHGSEDDDYIARLRALTGKPIFRAFKVKSEADLPAIENCAADLVLLDSGAGTGKTFDWSLVRSVQRPYFLAGGLDPDNIADAIAALFVSGIVVVVGFRLSRRAVTMLLDGGGKEHSEALEQALAKQLPLCRVRRLRVRESGADVFMDITVEAPATLRLDAAHDVSCVIEDIAHEIVPSADITVHVEPAQEETESMLQLVRTVAAAHKLSVHNLILSEQSGGLLVFLHVEASPDMTLREAHEYVVMFEKALGKRLNTTRIETHIEPEDRLCAPENALPFDADLHYVRAAVDSILPEFPMVSNVHDLRLTHMGGTPLVSFHCIIDGDLSLAAAHDVATDMERRLRTCAPKLDRILIHTDPSALIVMPEER